MKNTLLHPVFQFLNKTNDVLQMEMMLHSVDFPVLPQISPVNQDLATSFTNEIQILTSKITPISQNGTY